ncbi:MAG: hypothetical protein E6J61_18555 [Deltaproteobacteria bacterium]|nr:MAG: hypothetical protein E6J61_18555 [Deltaproteobacteria bacterium]
MDPVAPPSRRRRWRLVRALVITALLVTIGPLLALELGYQVEIARIPERPPDPPPSLPPLVVRSLGVQLFDTPDPRMTPIYPWTPFIGLARFYLGARPHLIPEELAARQVMRSAGRPQPPTKLQRLIEVAALATWISRHLSAREAISVALSQAHFAPDVVGIAAAARRFFDKSLEELDAGEIAALIAGSAGPSMYPDRPERLRAPRDALLRKLHDHGLIDEPTMQAAMERDVRRFK